METESPMSAIMEGLICGIMLYLLYTVLQWYIRGFSNGRYSPVLSASPCGGGTAKVRHPKSSRELGSKMKACIAVGICDEERASDRDEIHKWKKAIILNADKIFASKKSPEKPSPKKKK